MKNEIIIKPVLPCLLFLTAVVTGFLWCGNAAAQIALQDGTPLTAATSATSASVSTSFTVTTGAQVLVVSLYDRNQSLTAATNGPSPSSLSWGTQTITRVVSQNNLASHYADSDIFYLWNPTPGTQTITATDTTASTPSAMTMQVFTLNGVNTNVAPASYGIGSSDVDALPGNAISVTLAGSTPGGAWAVVNASAGDSSASDGLPGGLAITSSSGATNWLQIPNNQDQVMGVVENLAAAISTVTAVDPTQNGTQVGFAVAVFAPVAGTPAPTNVVATGQTNQVALSWQDASGGVVTNYIVLRSTTSNSGYGAIATNNGNASTHYTDTSVVDYTTYYYVVQATGPIGLSPYSSTASAFAVSAVSEVPVPGPTAVWESLASPGSWASIENWSNYFVANNTFPFTNVTADLSELTLTQNMTVTLDGNWTIGCLVSGDKGNTYNWTINPGSGSQLVLNNNSNAPSVVTVNNGTNSVTAVLAGLNGLVKSGDGVLALLAQNTYSNGTIVNAGSLYAGPGGQVGTIWGPLTINSNATVYADRNWAFGYNTPAGGFTTNGGSQRGLTSITINPGGTLYWINPSGANSGGFAGNVITMTGGTFSGTTTWDWAGDGYSGYAGHAQFNVIPSPWTVMVTGGSLNERMGNTGPDPGGDSSGIICFNVGKGTTTNGIDLEWTIPIENNNGGNICMSGPGTMQMASSASTILSTSDFNNWVIVSNGVLLVECNVGTYTYGAVYGGVLGGNGTFNNAVTNYPGGTIEPGDLTTNVGQLAVYGNLVLEPGSTTMCRINLASTTGYQYDNVTGPLILYYGGTLLVTNVSGVPDNGDLTVGSSFNLFQDVGTYVGNFAALQLPPLGFGEAWSWSPSTGTLSVVPNAQPVIVSFGPLSNGSFPLTFGGENGHNYEVLTTTNLAIPLLQWKVLTSGTFGSSAVNYTDTTAAKHGQKFYMIESQ